MSAILTSLGAGSGIDVKGLVEQLTSAERAPRQELLDQRRERVETRISAMGQFRSALGALVTALGSRIGSGALSGIPSVSDPSVLTMQVDPGRTVEPRLLEVRQLARGQALASAPLADAQAPVGQGQLRISFGSVGGTGEADSFTAGTIGDLVVEVGPSVTTIEGLKNAINDAAAVAGAPVQAQLVSDAGGTRLMLRGGMGEGQGFIVEASGDPQLQAFAFGPGAADGMSRTQVAQDALVVMDGLQVRRPSNIINDLLPGARLALGKAAPGTLIAVEATRSPAELSAAVSDMAGALNELALIGRELAKGGSAAVNAGALASDGATRRALQSLIQIPSRQMLEADGNAPTRLSDVGLTLDRFGNFLVDGPRLAKAVEQYPDRVEQLLTRLNEAASLNRPAGPLRSLATAFQQAADGMAGQPTALQREQQDIAREQTRLDDRIERQRTLLTRQFAALDRSVGQYKSIQTFLQQQIDMWTKSLD